VQEKPSSSQFSSFIPFPTPGSCGLAGSSGGLASFVFALIFLSLPLFCFVFFLEKKKALLFFFFSLAPAVPFPCERIELHAVTHRGTEQTKYKRAAQQNGSRRKDKRE